MSKSTNPAHLRDNLNLFESELAEDERNRVRALDRSERYPRLTLEQPEANYLNIKLSEK